MLTPPLRQVGSRSEQKELLLTTTASSLGKTDAQLEQHPANGLKERPPASRGKSSGMIL
jgi:hypothetical protein